MSNPIKNLPAISKDLRNFTDWCESKHKEMAEIHSEQNNSLNEAKLLLNKILESLIPIPEINVKISSHKQSITTQMEKSLKTIVTYMKPLTNIQEQTNSMENILIEQRLTIMENNIQINSGILDNQRELLKFIT
jgi:hypothetical protein